MRKLPLVAAAVLGFLIALACFLPAQLISYWLPSSVTVGTLSGSVWNGGTDYLAIGTSPFAGRPLGAVHWKIHPLALFLGRLVADIELSSGEMTATGKVTLKPSGGIELDTFTLDATLSALPVGAAPIRWSGRVQADLDSLSVQGRAIQAVRGTINVHDLQAPPPDGQPIGSYRLSFDEGAKQNGRWIGKLQDLGGPLQVSGTLALGTNQDYLLEGLVTPRPGASEAVMNTLRFLGNPDVQGRRPFSIAGTY